MKAVILSAGPGKRLLPFTAQTPKCLLPVTGDQPVLDFQLRALARCGIRRAVVMVGFAAEKVEEFLATHPIEFLEVHTRYNPFFACTNNLVTCWLAIPEMAEDFVLLNGDTLFEPEALRRLLASREASITLAINQKEAYDEDDMKVTLSEEGYLKAVGKAIAPPRIHGESIGLMVFRGQGVQAFCSALDKAIRDPAAMQKWYLDAIDRLAQSLRVQTVSIKGLWWTEIDTPEDLMKARADLAAKGFWAFYPDS